MSQQSLGAFSVSLSVSDLEVSRAFYEDLGFTTRGGDAAQGWLILTCGPATVGLFKGMFEGNLLTFNPGWNPDATPMETFEDVRAIQARLQGAGHELIATTDPDGRGIGHITLTDPDGNTILIDQHVPAPETP